MKTCVIVTGGECVDLSSFSSDGFLHEFEKDEILHSDFVIACDGGGLRNASHLGLKVDLLIGDIDTESGETLVLSGVGGTGFSSVPDISQVIKLPCEKDDTDTMSAARYCVEHGFSSVILLCPFGGRLDHSFANLQTMLFLKKSGLGVKAFGCDSVCTVLSEEIRLFPCRKNSSFSVFACGEKSCGISIHGAKYNLSEATITNNFPIGISNEWQEDEISVAVGSEPLFIMECALI